MISLRGLVESGQSYFYKHMVPFLLEARSCREVPSPPECFARGGWCLCSLEVPGKKGREGKPRNSSDLLSIVENYCSSRK